MEKFLIVGLGNPGEKYEFTRHNIGFLIVDLVVEELQIAWKNVPYGKMAETFYKGRKLHLLKPDTFMNLSGKSVKHWMEKIKLKTNQLLVITDDMHLPLGKIRIRAKGSSGGHNGLKSIEEHLHTIEYPRLRFGIHKPSDPSDQVNYVLGSWTDGELVILKQRIPLAKNAVFSFCIEGLTQTMNQYNGI